MYNDSKENDEWDLGSERVKWLGILSYSWKVSATTVQIIEFWNGPLVFLGTMLTLACWPVGAFSCDDVSFLSFLCANTENQGCAVMQSTLS